jgi:DNA polymerase-4
MGLVRRIAHLDMDAFYASVELLRRPHLRGQPVIVGGRGEPNSRGVVTTCSYEARAFGVRSGMPLKTAARLCPVAVYLPVDFAEYRRVSRLFKQAVLTIAPLMEDRGIDEVYLDLTEHEDATRPLAQSIKDAVRSATGLSSSIGIAPNKLIAKIASDLDKPDGLTIVRTQDIATRIWPLPVAKINGIGPKANAHLAQLGIQTIAQLAGCDPVWLSSQFGKNYGRWLFEAANGIDERPIVTYSEPISRSRETTFDADLHPARDWNALAAILVDLCKQLTQDLAGKGYLAKTIGIKVRYDDFVIVTRDLTLPAPTAQRDAMRKAAFECLHRVPFDQRPHHKLRLIGVKASGLSKQVNTVLTSQTHP